MFLSEIKSVTCDRTSLCRCSFVSLRVRSPWLSNTAQRKWHAKVFDREGALSGRRHLYITQMRAQSSPFLWKFADWTEPTYSQLKLIVSVVFPPTELVAPTRFYDSAPPPSTSLKQKACSRGHDDISWIRCSSSRLCCRFLLLL